jgi:hypothetical protein
VKKLLLAPALLPTVLLLTVFFLFPGGCSQRKLPALGPSNLVTIVTNLGTGDEAIATLKAAFTRPVISVEQESRYAFEVHGFGGLGRQRDARNLVIVADMSRRDAVSRKAREVLGREGIGEILRRGAGWRVLPNIEALGQTMIVVAGRDRPSILRLLEAEAGELYASADSMITERTGDMVYMHGEDAAMGRYLYAKYGWTVRIPKGYKAAEDPRTGVVKLVSADTQQPSRLFLAYWTASRSGALDREVCLRLRARLAWSYYDEDRIDPSSTTVSEVTFQGRKALRIQGIWQNEKHLIGGPFFTLCFLEKGRLYLLDGVVFAPGMDKSPWLRQIEAIMHTFKDSRKAVPAR